MTAQELQRHNEIISENRALKQANEELREACAAARKWMDGFDAKRGPMRLHQEDCDNLDDPHTPWDDDEDERNFVDILVRDVR